MIGCTTLSPIVITAAPNPNKSAGQYLTVADQDQAGEAERGPGSEANKGEDAAIDTIAPTR
jgi:hypothetical protein